MPKKFVGMNSKALEAKARRGAAKQEEDAKKKKAIEDELWKDDDKNAAKKQKRKEEKEKKKVDQLEKKREAQLILEAELKEIKSNQINQKVTRHQLMKDLAPSNPKLSPISNEESPIEENFNRLSTHDEEARTVDEALNMLNSTQSLIDKHPEKRLKAAYTAFEAENLPRLRAENPSMRLSQVKQLMNKEWMKSPSNPINQRYINQK